MRKPKGTKSKTARSLYVPSSQEYKLEAGKMLPTSTAGTVPKERESEENMQATAAAAAAAAAVRQMPQPAYMYLCLTSRALSEGR